MSWWLELVTLWPVSWSQNILIIIWGIVHYYALNHCIPEHNTTMYCSYTRADCHVCCHVLLLTALITTSCPPFSGALSSMLIIHIRHMCANEPLLHCTLSTFMDHVQAPSHCCQGRLCLSKLSAGTLRVVGGQTSQIHTVPQEQVSHFLSERITLQWHRSLELQWPKRLFKPEAGQPRTKLREQPLHACATTLL